MSMITNTCRGFLDLMKGALLCTILAGVLAVGWVVYSDYRDRQLLESKVVEFESQLKDANTKIADKEKKIGDLTVANSTLAVENDDLTVANSTLTVENERKDAAMRLMKLDTRRAKFRVTETAVNDGKIYNTLQFTEFNKDQVPVGPPREVVIQGDKAYVDCWVVKFNDEYVESADLARGTALFVFKSIFGSDEAPSSGTSLDQNDTVPGIYQSDPTLAALAGEIFVDFWQIAHDPQKAQKLGIRAIHGQAVSIKLRQDYDYWVTIRNAGGITIKAVLQ